MNDFVCGALSLLAVELIAGSLWHYSRQPMVTPDPLLEVDATEPPSQELPCASVSSFPVVGTRQRVPWNARRKELEAQARTKRKRVEEVWP